MKEEKDHLLEQFLNFLEEYQVVGLGMAVVIGGAVNKLTKSLAEDIIMPIVAAFIPSGAWRTLKLNLLGVKIAIGSFLSALIDFLIIAFIVFLFYKFILRKKEVTKVD
ncbi:MAG: MscL family protein [Patescibacteria group bacterium]